MRRIVKGVCFVAVLALALCAFAGVALAEPAYVAKVENTSYETLQQAIDNADGKTVTLLGDVNESVTIPVDATVTLNLGGFKLTNTDDIHTITNEGTLIVQGSGTVDNVSHARAALFNAAGAVATLNGGKFTRSLEAGTYEPYGGNGNSFYVVQNQGTLTINAGVVVEANGGFSSLMINGGKTPAATLTINGGSFSGGVNTVKNDANGTLNVANGTFENYVQHALMNWNVANVNGGQFTAADRAAVFNGEYGEGCEGTLTITGGEFASDAGIDVIQIYAADAAGTISISGGTYSSANAMNYLKDDADALSLDGTYYVGTAEALAAKVAGAQSGSKIVLVKGDFTLNIPAAGVTVTLGGDFVSGTVNGHEIPTGDGIVTTAPVQDVPQTGERNIAAALTVAVLACAASALAIVFYGKKMRHTA